MVGLLPHGSSEVPGGDAGSGANLSGKIWHRWRPSTDPAGCRPVGDGVTTTRPVADWPGDESFQSPHALAGRRLLGVGGEDPDGGEPAEVFEAFADDERFRRILLAVLLATRLRTRSRASRASAVRSRRS